MTHAHTEAHTVAHTFRATARAWPDNAFLCILPETAASYGETAQSLTYAKALDQIEQLARSYAHARYGPGHRIGLMLDNRPAFFLHRRHP